MKFSFAAMRALAVLSAAGCFAPVVQGQSDEECPEPETPFELSAETMEMAVLAADASDLVYDNARSEALHQAGVIKFYRDEPDAVLTRMHQAEGYCLVAFRGTIFTSLADWNQNTAIFPVEIRPSCSAGIGIVNAFLTHAFEVSNDVDECMAACAGCKLLITGHSQGGAIANVAAAIFGVSYVPYVVTFGQPRILGDECKPYVANLRWYRFIRAITCDVGVTCPDGLTYDVVPMIPVPFGNFYGHEIVMSNCDLSSVHYIGLDDHEFNAPNSVAAHSMAGYLADLKVLESNIPIETRGFNDFACCTEDDECISQQCEEQIEDVGIRTCVQRKEPCEECDEDYECLSGCCIGDFLFLSGECAGESPGAPGELTLDVCEPTASPTQRPTPSPTPRPTFNPIPDDVGPPTDRGSGNDSRFSGDPHIVTFGGTRYDCQGSGEFGMVQNSDLSFAVQGRFTQFSAQQITVTTGVLIQDTGSAAIQFSEAREGTDPATLVLGGCPVHIFLGGDLLAGPVGNVLDNIFDPRLSGVSVTLSSSTVRVTYNTGVDLVISVSQSSYFGCWFHSTVYVPFSFRPSEMLIGVLGSANNNAVDGWLDRNGTSLPFTSGIAAGYDYCVENWFLSEAESMFSYETGASYADFADPGPYQSNINLDLADQDVKDFCEGDENCLLEGLLGGINAAQDLQVLDAGLDEIRGLGLPTVSPTLRPTRSPTTSPTRSPSTSPTSSPSATPTSSPSATPTATPSSSPVGAVVEFDYNCSLSGFWRGLARLACLFRASSVENGVCVPCPGDE